MIFLPVKKTFIEYIYSTTLAFYMFWDWILTISLGVILSMFELDNLYNTGQLIVNDITRDYNKAVFNEKWKEIMTLEAHCTFLFLGCFSLPTLFSHFIFHYYLCWIEAIYILKTCSFFTLLCNFVSLPFFLISVLTVILSQFYFCIENLTFSKNVYLSP